MQGLDTIVCEYRDQDALAKGQASLLEQWGREGGHTGVAYHQKLTVIGVVDRARHDPNGKVIHQVIETFRKIQASCPSAACPRMTPGRSSRR